MVVKKKYIFHLQVHTNEIIRTEGRKNGKLFLIDTHIQKNGNEDEGGSEITLKTTSPLAFNL